MRPEIQRPVIVLDRRDSGLPPFLTVRVFGTDGANASVNVEMPAAEWRALAQRCLDAAAEMEAKSEGEAA